MCVWPCECMCTFQNDRITTHAELCSGNSRPRERMRQYCNIFIRQEQAPLAKNEFVRLLDRPHCTSSAEAELDSTTFERKLLQAQSCVCTWDRQSRSTDNKWADVKTMKNAVWLIQLQKAWGKCITKHKCVSSTKSKSANFGILVWTHFLKSNSFLRFVTTPERTFCWHGLKLLHLLMMAESF